MKKLIVFLIVLISTSIYISCDSNTTQEISAVVTNPTYVTNIEPVISTKCAGCHSGGNQSPNLETYLEVKEEVENGTVLCRINGSCGDIMPTSGKMPQATITMIELWKTQGYAQ
jgi:hypothetical protein